MIQTINNLEFEYFTRKELVEYKEFIENRIKDIDNGLEIKERPLRYFASVDVMYGDADGYSTFTEEISREDFIKLQLFGFVNVTFFSEHFGDTEGQISDFVEVKQSVYNLEKGTIKEEIRWSLDKINDYIDDNYTNDLDYEKLYQLYLNESDFDIKTYKIKENED